MRRAVFILLLIPLGCVQVPNAPEKVNARSEKTPRPDPVRADQVNDENANRMAQRLWDELENDR